MGELKGERKSKGLSRLEGGVEFSPLPKFGFCLLLVALHPEAPGMSLISASSPGPGLRQGWNSQPQEETQRVSGHPM